MRRSKYIPTSNDKAVIRRLFRALSDAGLSDNIDASDITVSSRGFSITGLSLNEFSAFTNQIEDIAQLAAVQRGVSRKHKTMTAAVEESRPLPADYTRARVVKKTGSALMISLGIFSEEELELVSNIGYIIAPSERSGEGLTVQVIDGLRTWSCATSFGQIMVKGAPASFSGSHTLSPRFVRIAEHLANLGDPVEITVEDDVACASNDMGKEFMAVATTQSLVESLDGDNITSVEISQVSLYHMLNWGSSDPAAYVSEEEMSKVPAVSVFKVEPEMLGMNSSYDEVGCNRMSTFQFATVSGPTGEFAVDRIMIRRIASFLLLPGNIPLTVSFDLDKGTVVQFAGANWKIMLNRMNTGAGRYHEDLLETLRDAKFDFVEGDDSRICINYEGQLIVLDLLDGRWPIVRCTIELVSGVERTLDLLKEIDMQNEGRVNTKYFMRGDSVIACVDVRCDGLSHLEQELKSLVADSDLLGSYLASLGIVGDELSLI